MTEIIAKFIENVLIPESFLTTICCTCETGGTNGLSYELMLKFCWSSKLYRYGKTIWFWKICEEEIINLPNNEQKLWKTRTVNILKYQKILWILKNQKVSMNLTMEKLRVTSEFLDCSFFKLLQTLEIFYCNDNSLLHQSNL